MPRAAKPKRPPTPKTPAQSDDFLSVARRLGCDEDKAVFEKNLDKIARAKVPSQKSK